MGSSVPVLVLVWRIECTKGSCDEEKKNKPIHENLTRGWRFVCLVTLVHKTHVSAEFCVEEKCMVNNVTYCHLFVVYLDLS